jgi:hypothetical protein
MNIYEKISFAAKKYIEYIYTFDCIPEYKIGIDGFIKRVEKKPFIP